MVTTIPSAEVLPACPLLSDVAATFAPAALSFRSAADAQTWAGALARPQGRVEGTGVGYAAAAPAVAAKRREVDRDVDGITASGKRVITNGTTGSSNQQDQLHLMSRRDPRLWRPPV